MNENRFEKVNKLLTAVALVSMLAGLAGQLEIVILSEVAQVSLLFFGVGLVAFGNAVELILLRKDTK
jgi:hypothetical protein